MKQTWKYGAVVVAAAFAVVSARVAAQRDTGEFERTLAVDGPVELDVAAGAGAISVRDGQQGRVEIRGEIRVWSRRGGGDVEETIRAIEADPPIEQSGNSLRVGYLDHRENVSISYDIVVPRETRVISRSGSGAQTFSGIVGPVDVTAGSGAISLERIGGAVEARTGSGSIHADGIAGGFRATAGSGSIRVAQTAPGDVDVSTGSGSSDVSGVDGALRVRSGSGSINVEGTPRGPWNLEAGSGSIRVRLPTDAAFDVDAAASSGGIHTSHPVASRGEIRRGQLRGQVRGGGPLLRVRTGSGGVRIE